MNKRAFDELLCKQVEDGVTEYYLSPGAKPFYRLKGQLIADEARGITTPEGTQILLDALLTEREKAGYLVNEEIEIPYAIAGVGRFRLHFGRQRSSVTITVHIKNAVIPSTETLKLPESVIQMAGAESGLLILSGSKKSGKSTTAAALVQHISMQSPKLIGTIEQPVRYLLGHGKGIINQREVGIDVSSVCHGIKDAVRDYADVIYVSNLSDRAAVEQVFDAVERGYFVIACMYGDSVESVLNRLQYVLGPDRQSQTKLLLANHLRGAVCQKLIKGTDGRLTPIFEVLVGNQSVRRMLEENKLGQLEAIFDTQEELGTIGMDKALTAAVKEERISLQTAVRAARNPKKLQKSMMTGA